jgi:hypothetical protein
MAKLHKRKIRIALPRPAQWACDEAHEIVPTSEVLQTAEIAYEQQTALAEPQPDLGSQLAVQRRLEITVPQAAVTAYGGCEPGAAIPERLQTLVVEHAYDAYGAGTGDNLGPCTVRLDHATGNYTLSYVYTAASTPVNLSANWDHAGLFECCDKRNHSY